MPDNASTVSSSVSSASTTGPKLCIICAGTASNKIVKDCNFQMMMDLYWKGIRVDVKPEMIKHFDLCVSCFGNVLQFYQINDVLVYFESRLRELQRGILGTNLKGILTWQEKGLKLHKLQHEIMKEWGTQLEPLTDQGETKTILDAYQVTQYQKDDPNATKEEKKEIDSDENLSEDEPDFVRKTCGKRIQSQLKDKRGPTSKKLRRGRSKGFSDEGSDTDATNRLDKVSSAVSSDDESITVRERTNTRVKTFISTNLAYGVSEKECKICLDKFPSSSSLQKHLRQHKVLENDGKFECRVCLQQFNRLPKLVDHKKTCCFDHIDESSSNA